MSIYNRPYMRSDYTGPRRTIDAVKWLLLTLGGVFIFQMVLKVWVGQMEYAVFESWFALSVPGILHGFIHTLATYSLLHDPHGIGHIFFNGLMIYFVGRAIQAQLGGGRLFELFFGGAIAGGLVWLLVQLARPGADLIGASAGAYALLSFFALRTWNETLTLYLYIIPIRLTGKQLFYASLLLQVFFFVFTEMAPGTIGRVAYSAHLGGIGFGWVYFRHLAHRPTLPTWIENLREARDKQSARRITPTGRYSVNLSTKKTPSAATKAEVDRILDKINSSGFGSLTAEEKATLDRAKDTMR